MSVSYQFCFAYHVLLLSITLPAKRRSCMMLNSTCVLFDIYIYIYIFWRQVIPYYRDSSSLWPNEKIIRDRCKPATALQWMEPKKIRKSVTGVHEECWSASGGVKGNFSQSPYYSWLRNILARYQFAEKFARRSWQTAWILPMQAHRTALIVCSSILTFCRCLCRGQFRQQHKTKK